MLIGEMEALFVKYGYTRSGWQRWDAVTGQNLDFNDSNEVMEDILQRVKDGDLILESASSRPSAPIVPAGWEPSPAQQTLTEPNPAGDGTFPDDIPF